MRARCTLARGALIGVASALLLATCREDNPPLAPLAPPATAGSTQEQWLRADLAASSRRCTLAYWHSPRFFSGSAPGGNTAVRPLWDDLYAAGAEIVINAHFQNYERFAPQTPDGTADTALGIREFVVARAEPATLPS